jgi:hypothetical protein
MYFNFTLKNNSKNKNYNGDEKRILDISGLNRLKYTPLIENSYKINNDNFEK